MRLVGNKRAIRSPEFHKRQRRIAAARWTAWTLLLLLLVGGPVYALRLDRFLISKVEIVGNEVTPDEEILRVVTDSLAGDYLWLIPKSNFLLAPKSRIEQTLMEVIPRLVSADVSDIGTNILEVRVSEREPYALYCKEAPDLESLSGCYFLDEAGTIFSEAPDFSGTVYMVYSSEPVLTEPLRAQLMEPSEFRQVRNFVSAVSELSLEPSVLTKRGNEYALTLRGGTELEWMAGQDLERLIGDLKAFLRDAELKPSAFGDLLYIDLRFENKVFYKFRD